MFKSYLESAKRIVAAGYGADASVFDGGIHVVESRAVSGARLTSLGAPFLDMTYFGGGLLAVADGQIKPFIEKMLAKYVGKPFRAFDAPDVFALDGLLAEYNYGVGEIAQALLPTGKRSDASCDSAGLTEATFVGAEISSLYAEKGFVEALTYECAKGRRDELAAAFFASDKPVAVAACSNDYADMWQIGVGVLPEYRGRGLAAKLVADLTALIEKNGKTPFYRAAWSNIASRRTAQSAGYRDAWVELFAVPTEW